MQETACMMRAAAGNGHWCVTVQEVNVWVWVQERAVQAQGRVMVGTQASGGNGWVLPGRAGGLPTSTLQWVNDGMVTYKTNNRER